MKNDLTVFLQRKYPDAHAVSPMRIASGMYCVGGVFCAYRRGYARLDLLTYSERFPSVYVLAEHLREHNAKLSPHVAAYFARRITALNDCGEIAWAWRVLDRALTHGQ